MVLKSSNDHLAGIALLRDLEEQYGSLVNVPDDNEQLLYVRKKLGTDTSTRSSSIPLVVYIDHKRKPIYTTSKHYEPTYQLMVKHNMSLNMATKQNGITNNSFEAFLANRHAKTTYFQMDFKGRKIKSRTASGVMNEAKKFGYRSTQENAVISHDLHKVIVLAPIIFGNQEPLKSR